MDDRLPNSHSRGSLASISDRIERYKAARRGTQLDNWPSEDRARWHRAKEKRGPFDRDAVLHGLEKPTVRGLEQSLGRFLAYVVIVQQVTLSTSIGSILTPKIVNEYIGFMAERLRAGSVHEELRRLHTGLGILLPRAELDWMNTLPLKPSHAEVVASRKPIDRPDAARVLAAAYGAFDAIPVTRLDTETAQAARNCLAVAFSVLLGLRLGDLTRIRIGEHLRQSGPRWRLMFSSEVKNGSLLLFDIPPPLAQRLETYLATWRAALLGNRPDHGRLWIVRGGHPAKERTIAVGIDKFGRKYLARSLNSHLFRHAFAVTTILGNPADADLAAAGLGHTSEQMVHGTYTRSDDQAISRLWLRKLAQKRRKSSAQYST